MSWRLGLLAFLVVAAGVVDVAYACSCGRERTVQEARSGAAFVVTGTVRAIHPSAVTRARLDAPGDMPLPRVWPVSVLEIDVTRSIIGTAPRSIELTHIGCCVCEANLDVGKEYLLFVLPSSDVRNAYMVSFCYPNRRIEEAERFLQQLPAGVRYDRTRRAGSAFGWLRWQSEAFANLLARLYINRVSDYPFIDDPLRSIRESPWLLFAAWVSAGLAASVVVVTIRRRIRRT